jgi:hypothetical protein
MAKTRIKKPVRKKKKSDYPGEMSFRKALGMNPTYYQDGGDYNMQRALELGYTPDETGHWASVDSTNGMWLKSKQHPTAWMEYMHGYALNPENNRRFDLVPNVEGYFGDNQLQYVEKNRQDGGKLYYQENIGQLSPSTGFNFSGYLDGNQGLIPDYNNIPTKSHISNILLNTPLPVVKPADKPKDKSKKSDVLDLDNSLDYLVNTRGGTRDLWGNMADTIGYHESAHTMDPGQLQKGGGPGRGIFQFEAPSLVTAQNRYKRIADRLKLKTDPEILKAKSAIELSPEQQYALFLINLSESKATLKDYADKKLSLENLWLQGHKNKEAKGDRGSFRTSVQKAKKDSIKSGYSTLKEFGGNLRYARGGSLTSAQDTAQAADLNKDIMRKDIKKASVGEDFLAGLYGVGEGLLDTVTFGLTDELTDAGFKALQAGAGHDVNSVEAKRQAGIAGWGNVGGAVTGAIINPASAFSAGQEGLEGIGQGIQGINPEDKTLQAVGKGVEGLGNIQLPKGMESMEGMSKLFMARNGGRFRYGYRGGGHMLNQNMGLTEIDGPSHEEGGVTLPNNGGRPDVEVEGPETIYTPENYVMSEKMKASLEALEFAGITGKSAKSLAGKSYADLSKMIKSKAGDKLRPNDPLSKKMLDKEMKRLMMAHEYDREAKRMQDEAMRTQMMGGSNVVAETPEQRAGGYNMYPNAQSIAFPGSGPTSVVPTYNNDPIMVTGADGSQQMLTDEPIETEAPFIEEKMAQGGKMIKRADGSYSKRGLWDNIRANRGSGKKPTKQMLEQEAKIKAAEKAYGGYYADGGSFNNPGFRALPSYVQAKIKSNMALGGDMAGLGMEDESLMQGASSFLNPITQTLNNVADIESQENEYQMQLGGYMGDYISDDDTMEYGQGGYTVRKSNDRKGKTHVVTGPDGTKKYFGDPKLGERGKSKYGKDAFYARHKKNLAKNPYFRAYARATWEDGGYMNMLNSNVDMADMETPMYAYGGPMMYAQGGIHIDPAKRGTFKAQASRMGMGVQEAARTILNAPEGKYSPAMRKKANFARNFAKEYGGYYQMGGEMMQAPQQGQPQGGGGEEQILQQVAQMLQQGMSPEEIVGQLVQMGVPQEQAIQVVQMVVQQMQGQQQAPQEAPQQAPPMMRGGGYMYQMGGEMAPQQAPQQQAPQQQAQGGEEQIVQAIMQMLQQGMQPEEIVGELVKMGLPQEAAIQAVQMVMQQSQQGQQGQQQQMPTEAPAPMMRYGGRVTKQMGGSLADNYLSQVNQYPVLKRNGGKLYYQQNQGYLVPENKYSSEAVSTPDDYERIYDIVGNTLDRETKLGYSNYGFTQPGATQYPNTKDGRNQAINAGIDQYFNKYGLYEMPDSQQAMAFDFAFNSEDPRASMMVAAGKLTPAEKVSMYSKGKLDPDRVDQSWKKYGADVMAMGDALNDPFAAEKTRSYGNTTGATTKLPEWTNRVNEVKTFAPKYFSNNQPNSLYKSVPVPWGVPSTTTSGSTSANNTEPPLPTYESPMGNYIAGGLGSMFGPLANAAAAAFAPDPTYTAAPKFKKFDYTPVALQRAAGNQAMANTRQAIRMGAPTQGSYLANVGVAMPSAGAQIGTQLAQTRYGIDSQNIGLINQEAQLRAAQAEKNALMKDQSISNRWKLGMEAAAGTGRNIQGFSKDMGAKGMQDQLLNQLRTGDFAVIGYDNVNGTLVPKLAPTGVATYNDGTITLSNGQRARRNPNTGKFELIP